MASAAASAMTATTAGRQGQLRRILLAYAARNKRVRYCQGMNFVGRLLLDAGGGDEHAAFEMLCVVVERCGMAGVWSPGMRALAVRFYQLDRLLARHLPVLAEHLAAPVGQ